MQQGLTDAQLAMRRTGIGASECGVVLGLSSYVDPLTLYLQKRGLLVRKQTPEQRLGHLLEPVVDALYQDRFPGVDTLPCSVTLRHPEHPWVLATPDRFCATERRPEVVVDRERGCLSLGECHFDHIAQYKSARRPEAQDWGPEGTDEVPLGYFAQVQWEMAVTGQSRCDLAVLVAGSELRVYRIDFSPTVFARLFEANATFWHDHVLAGRPPELDGGKGGDALLRLLHPKEKPKLVLQANEEATALFAALREAKAQAKVAQKAVSLANQRICALMGEAERLNGEGFYATWKTQRGRVGWKPAAEDAIDLLDRARTQLKAGLIEPALATLDGQDGLRERNAGAPARAFRTTFAGEESEESE